MPRAANPSATFPVVLKSDGDAEPRPTFHFKYLTANEFDEARSLIHGRDATEGGEPLIERDVLSALRIGLRGWEKMPPGFERFEPDRLGDLVGLDEAFELAYAMIAGGQLSGDDQKNSSSLSLTSGDKSDDVTAENQSEHQRPNVPQISSAPFAAASDASSAMAPACLG